MIRLSLEIQSSDCVEAMAQRTLRQGLDSYCSFALIPLSQAIPVAGSWSHDAGVQQVLQSALLKYKSMVEADVNTIRAAHESLMEADAAAAASM